MAFTFAAVVGILAGIMFALSGLTLALLRPTRPGTRAFGAYAILIGVQQILAYVSVVVPEVPLALALSWPFMVVAAIAIISAVAKYTGRDAGLWVIPFGLAATIGAILIYVSPRSMLYPDGGPNDLGVITWQMPVFIAIGLGAWWIEGTRRREGSSELRIECLLLLIALVPHLGYTSSISFLVAATTPGVELWRPAYFITFGGGLLASLAIAVSLWRSGGKWETRLAAFIVVVTVGGAVQYMVNPQFILFGGALRILAALFLGYGLLKYNLFGVDLKIKWTLDKGALLAIFGGVFFIVDQAAQFFVSDAYGALAGVIAALLLVFALAPLRKIVHRVVDKAMPHVQDTAEYFATRRLTIYRAAAQSAARDGAITPDERSMLDALVAELGLGEEEARAVEAEALRPHAA